jgi:hypothetical protein
LVSGRALTTTLFLFAAAIACARPATAALPAIGDGRSVAIDIDRDGDLDIVTASGGRLTVWVNDGAGHLTPQRPSNGPGLNARAPGTTFRGTSESSEPTTNDGTPTTALLVVRAHAPPALTASDTARVISFVHPSGSLRSSAPRAPPQHS